MCKARACGRGSMTVHSGASDLIAECVTIMEYNGSAEDIARCTHTHPTLSEAVGEAARMAWSGQPLNS